MSYVVIELKSKRRTHFDNKLTKWAAETCNFTQLQEEKFCAEVAAKEEMLKLKVEREKELSQLLTEEVKLRMRCTLEKHKAEMELLNLQRKQLIHNL